MKGSRVEAKDIRSMDHESGTESGESCSGISGIHEPA
jgi:hypothetical protein